MAIDCNTINLRKGATGENVKQVQKYLKYLKFYNRQIDGEYGSYTVEAVKKLQKKYGLKEDGWFGELTCKNSGINGINVSNTIQTIQLSFFENMIERVKTFIEKNNREPRTIIIDINNPYEYIVLDKYKEAYTYYTEYIKKNNKKPDLIYINTNKNGKYNNDPHLEKKGCNNLGQCNGYYCAPHSIRQVTSHFGLANYLESRIASWAGTTTNGTGHGGINTALQKIAKSEDVKLNVKWMNFSDLGSNTYQRFKKLGELIVDRNVDVIIHSLYRLKYGHYETIKEINLNNKTVIVNNSLGDRCGSPAYCGYLETRGFDTFASYIANNYAGQPSICLIELVRGD